MKNAVEVNKDKLDNPEVKLKNGLEVLHLYDIHIETRSLYLVGEINDMSFRQTLKNLHYLDSLNNDPINFHICSEGGLLDYAYSLYDHMQSINSPTNTIGSGKFFSLSINFIYVLSFKFFHRIPDAHSNSVTQDRII